MLPSDGLLNKTEVGGERSVCNHCANHGWGRQVAGSSLLRQGSSAGGAWLRELLVSVREAGRMRASKPVRLCQRQLRTFPRAGQVFGGTHPCVRSMRRGEDFVQARPRLRAAPFGLWPYHVNTTARNIRSGCAKKPYVPSAKRHSLLLLPPPTTTTLLYYCALEPLPPCYTGLNTSDS